MIKKLFTHTAIYGLAPQITRIASIFALPIITRDLTSEDFGVYGIITAISGAIAVLGSLGLRLNLTNSYYKSPNYYKWGWRQIYGFLMLWNIPYSIILASIIWSFIPNEASSNTVNIILLNVLPVVFFGPTSIIGITYYQLKQQPGQIAVRSVIFGILTVLLNVYFISVLKQGYMGWFLSTAITTMLNQMSFYIPMNFKIGIKPIFNFKWRYIKNALKVAIPTIPHYYSTYLLDSSDRLIMKSVGTSISSIGMYNAAYTIGNFLRQAGMAAGFAVGPMLNAAYKEQNEEKARDLVFILQIVFFTGSFILCLWMKEIFYILLKNKELQQTYNLGIVIVMAYCYRPMYLGANSRLFYLEKTVLLLRVTFIAAIINVVLNFIFIPFFGIKAAAMVTFISLMYMGYAGFYLKVFRETNSVRFYPVLWLTINVLLTLFSLLLVDNGIFLKLVCSVIGLSIGIYSLYVIIKKSGLRNG